MVANNSRFTTVSTTCSEIRFVFRRNNNKKNTNLPIGNVFVLLLSKCPHEPRDHCLFLIYPTDGSLVTPPLSYAGFNTPCARPGCMCDLWHRATVAVLNQSAPLKCQRECKLRANRCEWENLCHILLRLTVPPARSHLRAATRAH